MTWQASVKQAVCNLVPLFHPGSPQTLPTAVKVPRESRATGAAAAPWEGQGKASDKGIKPFLLAGLCEAGTLVTCDSWLIKEMAGD